LGRVVLPLVGRLQILVVAGFVSRINMICRPLLVRQIAILSPLPGKILQQQQISQAGLTAASRNSANKKKLTAGGRSRRWWGGSPQFQFSGSFAWEMLLTRRATWALESSSFDVRVGSSRLDMWQILWARD
jgi:hypothetical protein